MGPFFLTKGWKAVDISEQPAKTIFDCGADLDGDIFYYRDPKTGSLVPVFINHLEVWLDGYRSAMEMKRKDVKEND